MWRALPGRAAALGIRVRRLRWTPAEILDFAEARLRAGTGAWVMGVYGALAEFVRDRGEPVVVVRDETAVQALTPRAGIRIAVGPSVRAFAHEDATGAEPRILLALPRVRLAPAGPAAFAALGPDAAALRPEDRSALRFDIGLGRAAARFTVRTADPDLAAALSAAEGMAWPAHLAATFGPLLAANPARVVETALGRIEVDAPIPPPGGVAPTGPHTHLLPGLLAYGRELPPEMELPPAFAAGAAFYP